MKTGKAILPVRGALAALRTHCLMSILGCVSPERSRRTSKFLLGWMWILAHGEGSSDICVEYVEIFL